MENITIFHVEKKFVSFSKIYENFKWPDFPVSRVTSIVRKHLISRIRYTVRERFTFALS